MQVKSKKYARKDTQRGISITSRSLNEASSMVKRMSVRTWCHPYSPAAPGLM
jgi:hypothetical protein